MRQTALILLLLLPRILTAESDGKKAETATPAEAQKAAQPEPESVLFETPPAVETAALYTQTLQEAPANVTVITQQQIRNYGYRTLAEALSNVRGFFTTTDGDLQYAGVRGFNLPGDYNTRILVMLNGHFLTDNVYGAMYMFGQDFGIDMDLVERIEIVRGPSSALYGSNGMFATINIFTRAPSDSARAMVSTEFGSFVQKKMLVSTSTYLGRGANLLISGSVFHTTGRSVTAPELGNLTTGSVGAEEGYHTFAQLTWRNWSVTANFQDRKAIVPIGWFGADFGDTGTSTHDSHNFVEAAFTKSMGDGAEIRWRLSYDQFRYYGRYDYTADGVTTDNRDYALGDWIGTQFSYRRKLGKFGSFTVGTQANVDLRNVQVNENVSPQFERMLEVSQPNQSLGVFGQYEYNLTKNLVLFAGIRFDDSSVYRPFVSPKLAAVWKASKDTSYKFMFGRAFRNPSTFERYYVPNPLLEAEKMNTYEFAREQRIYNRVDLIASVFHYRIVGLIEGVPIDAQTLQYRNVSTSQATGFEFEASGHPARWFETSASFSLHQAEYTDPQRALPNSPARLAQFRASVPLARNRLTVSAATRYLSSRLSPYGYRVDPVFLADATATTSHLHRNFDLQLGIRNLANCRYVDPLSTEHLIEVMPGAGRSVFFRLIWHYGE